MRFRKISRINLLLILRSVVSVPPKQKGEAEVTAYHLDESWQMKAACRGPRADLFFPPTHFEKKDEKEAREREAKLICDTCSVKKSCLQYALRIREPHGVWGGLNEAERKQLMAREAS